MNKKFEKVIAQLFMEMKLLFMEKLQLFLTKMNIIS